MMVASELTPTCWDRNSTVNTGGSCRHPETGEETESCLEIGYSSTGYIMRCTVADPNCGTFIEIHKPGQ